MRDNWPPGHLPAEEGQPAINNSESLTHHHLLALSDAPGRRHDESLEPTICDAVKLGPPARWMSSGVATDAEMPSPPTSPLGGSL